MMIEDPPTTKRSSSVEDPRSRTHGDDTVLRSSPAPGRNQTHNKHYANSTNRRGRRDPDLTHDSATATTTISRYRECQKNHAAHMGSHVVDGCGEFMPNGDEGTPESMRCAACDCHRNFHRKEINAPGGPAPAFQPSGTMMAFGVHAGEDLNVQQGCGSSRSWKRFRTKFTLEQKEKMMELAEKIGWRIQKKQDEEDVQRLCAEAGVKRQVFKVWMHNNRQAIKRKHS